MDGKHAALLTVLGVGGKLLGFSNLIGGSSASATSCQFAAQDTTQLSLQKLIPAGQAPAAEAVGIQMLDQGAQVGVAGSMAAAGESLICITFSDAKQLYGTSQKLRKRKTDSSLP